MKNKNKVENEIYKIFAKELNLSKNFNFKKNLKNKNLPNLDSLSWIIIISNISILSSITSLSLPSKTLSSDRVTSRTLLRFF